MKLKTITTIELNNHCDLACKYCINRLLKKHESRTVGIMSDAVFAKTMDLLQMLCDQGTQREVNLNGNGESLLDPEFFSRAAIVREIMGDRRVGFCTNGVCMTERLAKTLAVLDLDYVDVSPHSAFHARKAVNMLINAGVTRGTVNLGAITGPHNWAGQLEPENSVTMRLNIACDPLIEGRGYVQAEGNITPCCYDYRNLGVFGHVNDGEALLDVDVRRYSLCEDCHQVIPEGVGL